MKITKEIIEGRVTTKQLKVFIKYLKNNEEKKQPKKAKKEDKKEEFEKASKLPWESGRSWLYDIEKTISGIGHYLYQKSKVSRSGNGVQTQKSVNNLVFRPVKYFSVMLENFNKKIGK